MCAGVLDIYTHTHRCSKMQVFLVLHYSRGLLVPTRIVQRARQRQFEGTEMTKWWVRRSASLRLSPGASEASEAGVRRVIDERRHNLLCHVCQHREGGLHDKVNKSWEHTGKNTQAHIHTHTYTHTRHIYDVYCTVSQQMEGRVFCCS